MMWAIDVFDAQRRMFCGAAFDTGAIPAVALVRDDQQRRRGGAFHQRVELFVVLPLRCAETNTRVGAPCVAAADERG